MAADETQRGRASMGADGNEGRQPRMAADETQRGRDEIASYEKGDAEVGVDGADGAIIVNEKIMKIK